MKMVDYTIDGDEICDNKSIAIKRAQKRANEKHQPMLIQRWARPDRYSDLEIDENFTMWVKPEVN